MVGYTGRSAEMRGKDPAAQAAWSIHELQELGKYAALVSAAGYVPVALSPEEYVPRSLHGRT
ncbi:hypothetical protein [Streptomyces sp. GESEQ-4]|uniref:hypothetical protein n=1 Tax=Streptomyces sp. GESEQ-4 TaxID=2812655 RepID=UPI001B33CA31|nr:hypothetical protein [Streptomyces sp. GESEQ-4]